MRVKLDMSIDGVSEFWYARFSKARPKKRWQMLEALLITKPRSVSFGDPTLVKEDSDGNGVEGATGEGPVPLMSEAQSEGCCNRERAGGDEEE